MNLINVVTRHHKHAVARFTDVNVGVTGNVGQYKMAFCNVHKSSMSMKLTSNNVFWQSKVHLHSHKDICAHRSLPTLAILALGLLKMKDDEQFLRGQR